MKLNILFISLLMLLFSVSALASPAQLSSADETAAFEAAGYKLNGKQWHSSCDDPGTPSYTPGRSSK
jgi:hypothetical protein